MCGEGVHPPPAQGTVCGWPFKAGLTHHVSKSLPPCFLHVLSPTAVSSPLSTGLPPHACSGPPTSEAFPLEDLGAQPRTQTARRGRLPWITAHAPVKAATAAATMQQALRLVSEVSKLAQVIVLSIGPREFLEYRPPPHSQVAFGCVYWE